MIITLLTPSHTASESSQEIKIIIIYSSDGRKLSLAYKDGIADLSGFLAGLYHLVIHFSSTSISRSFVKE